MNVYQLFPRVFGNKAKQQFPNGSIELNGCGKFNDIDQNALKALKDFGITHIWLTGIIRHAKLTDYTIFDIPASHPALVKGRAGSPYAISDYYDVDPDLAVSVNNRMGEFEALIERIHEIGLKCIIDFVPNHVARQYKSIAKPEGIEDFGQNDKTHLAFHPNNNFYYLPGKSFVAPYRSEALYQANYEYFEQPSKATGNDCFSAMPSVTDWFDTVKLNYGVNISNNHEHHFDPIPDTWHKMLHILKFWSAKGVDGFRVDMAEMVPAAFWRWAIRALKMEFPEIITIAEIYIPNLYQDYIDAGFDLLYDKVGLYNRLADVLLYDHAAESISINWKMSEGNGNKMLRFLENHDEVRLASHQFLDNPFNAMPGVHVSAWMHSGAFMMYNGQESAEKAEGATGFSGDDGRTSIFDYCHMPQHQNWMNDGKFDGKKMSVDQQRLFDMYKNILQFRMQLPALQHGRFYDLMWVNPWFTEFDPRYVYAFLRYTENQRLLVVANFNKRESRKMQINFSEDAMQLTQISPQKSKKWIAINLLHPFESIPFDPSLLITDGLNVRLEALQTALFELKLIDDTLEG